MIINNICSPAIIYLGFSLTQIIIDIYKSMYNTAFLKFIVSIIFTIILNILCDRGLNIISWIIVFIPFIFMTVITSILLYMFGLDPFFGKLNYDVKDFDNDGIIINQNPRDIYTSNNISSFNNSDNLNSISNELDKPIIPNRNIENEIINKENSQESDLPLNRILDSNKKNNKNTQYSIINDNENKSNINRNNQANKNQNNDTKYLLNENNENLDIDNCFKSCLSNCNKKKNKTNESNYCNCENICKYINYKTI